MKTASTNTSRASNIAHDPSGLPHRSSSRHLRASLKAPRRAITWNSPVATQKRSGVMPRALHGAYHRESPPYASAPTFVVVTRPRVAWPCSRSRSGPWMVRAREQHLEAGATAVSRAASRFAAVPPCDLADQGEAEARASGRGAARGTIEGLEDP